MLSLDDFFWRQGIGIDPAPCAQSFNFHEFLSQSLSEQTAWSLVIAWLLVNGFAISSFFSAFVQRETSIWAGCRAVPEGVKRGKTGEQAPAGEIS